MIKLRMTDAMTNRDDKHSITSGRQRDYLIVFGLWWIKIRRPVYGIPRTFYIEIRTYREACRSLFSKVDHLQNRLSVVLREKRVQFGLL